MPYIPVEERIKLDPQILHLMTEILSIGNDDWDVRDYDGRLNYCITELLANTLELDNDPGYTKLNTALGVMEGVKLELYARVGRPYEDLKIEQAGDIGVFKRFTDWLKKKRKELGL